MQSRRFWNIGHSTMAAISSLAAETLAAETLAHIFELSVEDANPEEGQRARFRYGLVSRAFYLANLDVGDFHVAG